MARQFGGIQEHILDKEAFRLGEMWRLYINGTSFCGLSMDLLRTQEAGILLMTVTKREVNCIYDGVQALNKVGSLTASKTMKNLQTYIHRTLASCFLLSTWDNTLV